MSRKRTDELARQIAGRLTSAIDPRVPRDLNALAKSLGVVDVLYRTRIRHGFTEWTSRGPAIQIALSNTDGRRRATLAHECGHLLLDPSFRPSSFTNAPTDSQVNQAKLASRILGPVGAHLRQSLNHFELEHVCDRLAVELLLPSESMPGILSTVTDLASLKEASDCYRVSLAMLVIRLNEFGARNSLLQLERAVSGDWIVSSAVGVPPEWRGRVVGRGVERCDAGGPAGSQWLTLERDGMTVEVRGGISRVSNNRAVALLPTALLEGAAESTMAQNAAWAGPYSHQAGALVE